MKMLFAGAAALALIAACSPAPTPAAPVAVETPAAAAPATPVAITSPAGDYASDPTHSSLTFRVQHIGLAWYTMKFKTLDATVTLDPTAIANSKVVATLKPSDITVGYPADYKAYHPKSRFSSWEDDLANSTNFLNGGEFPTISFASTALEVTGERTAKMTGDLTLLGVTKPITLDVTFDGEIPSHPFGKAPALGFSATGSFKRSDFGSTALNQMIGDEVKVQIESDFIQKKPA